MEDKDSFPKYLSIQTTSMCNASCIFCPYAGIKNLFPPKVMDERLFRKIIDECSRHKDIERLILYMSNEPLTDPHLVNRINYAKEKVPWASVHILTNGSLLTEEMADKLIRSKLDWIGISLHGIRNDTLKKTMGIDPELTMGRVLKFLNKAKEHRNIKDFAMITFLGHRHLSPEEKKETFKFWRGQGIERISYFDQPISRAGNVESLPQVARPRIGGCKSIWANEMIHIAETGEVVLCCMDWKRKIILGDLNQQGVEEVWCSARYAEVRDKRDGKKDSEADFLCKRCEASIVPGNDLEACSEPAPRENGTIQNSAAGDEPVSIALIMVPPWQTKMPPLGLAYLDSFLRSNGVGTRVVDLNVKLFNKSEADKRYLWEISTINNFTSQQLGELFCAEFGREINDFVNEMAHSKETIIGLSTTIASLNVAVQIAHQIKQRNPSKLVVLGGPGVFWNTQHIDPERVIDIFVIGEGELPMLEIATRFKKNTTLAGLVGIPGTIVRLGNEYHPLSATPNPPRDIDQTPTVDFSAFNLNDYNANSTYRPLPVLTSRGCVNRCSFCVDHKMNFPFRVRSPQKVLEDLRYYVQKFNVRDFEFNDLLCNGSPKHLEAICDLLIKENLGISWHSYAAVRSGMTTGLLKKMRAAGCHRLCYGMESASDVVLKKMNKPYNAQVAEQVIRDTHNAGISTAINIIIGHPGESEKEFKKTCVFVEKNKTFIDEITNVSTCFLMPETDLVKDFDKYGIYFKKTLKERMKMFFKKEACPCNYRKFYARPDSSPRSRAMRLRKMLFLITGLKIPNVIVNRISDDDRDFEKLFQDEESKPRSATHARQLKINLDPVSKTAHIYFKDKKLTKNVGLNTSFKVGEGWLDSSTGEWVTKGDGSRLFLRINFKNIPVSQKWSIKLFKGSFCWEVVTFFHDEIRIAEQKTGVVFSDQYHQYAARGPFSDFPVIAESWSEVDLLRSDQAELISKAGLPKINLRREDPRGDGSFIQLQNLPASFAARMINFCLSDPNAPSANSQEGRLLKAGNKIKDVFKLTFGQK